MGKVFGYPEFDALGDKVLTTYKNDYRDMLMDIHVYRMSSGMSKVFRKEAEETAILLLKGQITFVWDGNHRSVSRKDVFTEGLWCLHVSRDTEVIVIAEHNTEILVQSTKNDNRFSSRIYSPLDAPWVWSCQNEFGGAAARRVSTVFDYTTAPYSNMVMGEVLNNRGNWSGYIPHHHPQPETYYFLFDRSEGFGASFVGDEVYKIKNGSFSAIPGGKTHPQVAAPGYLMYTCWMIRHLDNNPWIERMDDEQYIWLYDAKF